jgi:arsenical pump membrane protein
VAAVQISLLVLAVTGVFIPRLPSWAAPLLAAAALLVVGGITADAAGRAARPLLAPLAFLLLAVPLAVMLDRLGFFSSLAALADRGVNPVRGLWILAAAVTTFLNLDAAVVLLTPLYIRVARRNGLDATQLAYQPVLLASLASSALPISNLTNLIAAEGAHLRIEDFLLHLGPASLAAVVVGWFAYRRLPVVAGTPATALAPGAPRDPVDVRALRLGTPVVVFVVIGFTVGDALGIPAWIVALIADLVLVAMVRDARLSDVPLGAAALAVGLGIVATAAAPQLGLSRLFAGDSLAVTARTAGLAALGADTINNLPALLVSLPAVGGHRAQIWPLLFGLNFAPIFVLHGALAGLLWRATAARLGVVVTAGQYTKVGLRVGVPAVAVGLAVVLGTAALTG